jgi:hypothetical protein
LGMNGTTAGLGEETEFCLRIYKQEPVFYFDNTLKVEHWTPTFKLTLKYQLKRAYTAGKSARKHKTLNAGYSKYQIKGWGKLMIKILKIPVSLFTTRRTISQEFTDKVRDIVKLSGYLLAN